MSLLWLPLALAIVLGKSNLRLHLLWIVLPYAILKLGIAILIKTTGMSSEFAGVFEYLSFGPLLIGMASILLLGTRLIKWHGFLRFILAIGVFLCCIGMGVLSFGFNDEIVIGLVAYAVMASTVILAQVLSAWFNRKQFSKLKYLLWLAFDTMAFLAVGMTIYIIVSVMVGEIGDELPEILPQILLSTALFGGVLYALQLPIVFLGFFNRFYRERFAALMGLTIENKTSIPAASDISTETTDETEETC